MSARRDVPRPRRGCEGRVALALVVAFLAPPGCGGAPVPGPRPDVLLVTVDTLRADYLGTYGFGLGTSPRIDAFASGAVVFERAIAASSATAPSHASIFSSRYTRQHSVGYSNGDTRLEDVPTLAEVFRQAGYATGAFVGNAVLQRRIGLDRGFDVYDDELATPEINRGFLYERIAEETVGRALGWLREVEDEAVFLWVHVQDPHGPYAAPGAYRGRFRVPPGPGEKPLPVLEDNSGRSGIPAYQALRDVSLPSVYRSRYADEIFYADRWIGELIDAVEARASDAGNVVLLTADHGESLGEAGRFFVHAATTPEVARIPMILRAPGLAPARRREIVHHVDVMPTLLDLAGLAVPPGTRGVALASVLRGQTPLPARLVYCDSGAELSAYGGEGFMRVGAADAAWKVRGGGEAAPPYWVRYAWRADGSWAPEREGGGLADEVEQYLREALPMATTAPLGSDEVERLRALGYVEP